MVRLAYCLLVHKNPAQVKRLLDRLCSKEDFFYVNVFKARRASSREPWRVLIHEAWNPPLKVSYKYRSGWGTFRLVSATLDAMRFFRPLEYDYFVNLSGQCYPIKSIEEVRSKLGSSGRTFMRFRAVSPFARVAGGVDSPQLRNGGKDRMAWFNRSHYRIVWHEYGIVLKIPRLRKTLPCGLAPFVGSQWFCMKKQHVDYILDFIEQHPAVLRFFRHVGIPDESFFQTVLLNSPFRDEVINDRLRYTFPSGSARTILTMEDLPRLLMSEMLWARKFDINVDERILDELDRLCLKRQS